MQRTAEALLSELEAGDPREGAATEPPDPVPDDLTVEELARALALGRDRLLRRTTERAGGFPDPALERRLHRDLDTAAMEFAARIIQRRARHHNRLLQDISHDIRSPLNSILFLADALRTEQGGPLNPVQTRQADVLFMAAVSLVRLVNDLIDYARHGETVAIRVGSSGFSIEQVVFELRQLVEPLLTYHHVDLKIGFLGEGTRRGDRQILSRVLLNLVTNSVEALPEGGTVRVELDGRDRTELRVEVRDNGGDADVARLRSALDLGRREAFTGETRGWTHGLGLAIAARLVEAAGGRIAVRPADRAGVSFEFRLPFPSV